jgi:hypothetical protein
MNPELPPPIDRFFQAHNTGHTEDFNALFTADAVVSDEAHEYRGAAIKEWIDNAVEQYKPHALDFNSHGTNLMKAFPRLKGYP